MQRGGKGSGPTSPEVQEGGWITPWLMAEGRRPNDTPVSRWILTGISADHLLDSDWVNVCLSLVSRNRGKELFMTLSVTKNALMNQPLKVSTLKSKNIPAYKLFATRFWNLRKPRLLLSLLSGTNTQLRKFYFQQCRSYLVCCWPRQMITQEKRWRWNTFKYVIVLFNYLKPCKTIRPSHKQV